MSQSNVETPTQYSRRLIYATNLQGTLDEIKNDLNIWRFVGSSPSKQPIASIADGIMGVGTNDQTSFNYIAIKELADCSVECEVRIIDDGGDPSRWVGVRVRGFLYDFRFGYLVYLRRVGAVELYRAGVVLGGANSIIVEDTRNSWAHLRIDIVGFSIKVWVNGQLHIEAVDRKFTDKGHIYLHTFGTHAQVRKFEVYELETQETKREDEELSKTLFKLADLSPDQQKVLEMHYVNGLQIEDIADRMGLKEITVRRNLSRAKRKIRALR